MGKVVVDASVVLKWIPGKREKGVEKAREIYKMMVLGKIEVLAPTFLLIEVLNILIKKRQVEGQITREAVERLTESGISFRDLPAKEIGDLETIMTRTGVTAYDALYLYLAKKERCRLLTVDEQLLKIRSLTLGIEGLLGR